MGERFFGGGLGGRDCLSTWKVRSSKETSLVPYWMLKRKKEADFVFYTR